MNMDHEQIKAFYNSDYYRSAEAGELPWHQRKVIGSLGNLRGKRVLDIACGTGDAMAYFAAEGAEVAGIDISDKAIEVCRGRMPSAEVHVGVAESLPFASGTFDHVVCFGSLEHFLDQPAALAEMRRVLADKGGSVLVLVPNAGFLTRRLGFYAGTNQSGVRETVLSITQWQAMLTAAGLRIDGMFRDLRPLSAAWINRGGLFSRLVRAAQACALALWPMAWQYQVYLRCRKDSC